jgi:HD superfamily phosphodiesterase
MIKDQMINLIKSIIDDCKVEYFEIRKEFTQLYNELDEVRYNPGSPHTHTEEEYKQLLDECYEKSEKVFKDIINNKIINSSQAKYIISNLTPDLYMEIQSELKDTPEAGLIKEVGMSFDGFIESIITEIFLKNTPEDINYLLENSDLLLYINTNKGEFFEKCTNEDAILNYLVKRIISGADKFNINSNIETIFISNNYSLSLKRKILLDSTIKNNIDIPLMIRRLDNIPDDLIDIILNEYGSELDSHTFSHLLGIKCKTADDYIKCLDFENVDFESLLKDINMPDDTLSKIISSNKVTDEKIIHFILDNHDRNSFSNIYTNDFINMLKKYINTFPEGEETYHLFDSDNVYQDLFLLISSLSKLSHSMFTSKTINELLNNEEMISLFKLSLDKIKYIKLDEMDFQIAIRIINRYPDVKKSINSATLNSLLFADNVSIEEADRLFFDAEILNKIIDEINPKDKPQKYNKIGYLYKLKEKNPFISKSMYIGLLRDDILDLGFDFIEKISRYPEVAEDIVDIYEEFGDDIKIFGNIIDAIMSSKYINNINPTEYVTTIIKKLKEPILEDYYDKSYSNPKLSTFGKLLAQKKINLSNLNQEQWKIITELLLTETDIYSPVIMDNDEDRKLSIIPSIDTISDLNNYHERKNELCDKKFKEALAERNLNKLKNIYLNKFYNIDIGSAIKLCNTYGSSIDKIDNTSSTFMQIEFITGVQKVLDMEKIETIEELYNTQIRSISFDELMYIKSTLNQIYSKDIENSVYKVGNAIIDENGNTVDGGPKEMSFEITDEQGNIIKKNAMVYEPGFDFKMLIHSTDAYGSMELINDNYYDSWNKSSRKSNHGICCSLIANCNMGMAEVNDVLLGFAGWDEKAITQLGPYDLYTYNDSYDITSKRLSKFMSAQDIIDNTRHTHNEGSLERYELREEYIQKGIQNIQPSYVIIYSDMEPSIKAKAFKCSNELNIPIVYLDKEKLVKNENRKIDQMMQVFNTTTDLNEKMKIAEKILLAHENNRSGLRMTNPDWIEQYFPTNKIDSMFKSIINEMQSNFKIDNDINEYFKQSTILMDILNRENEKFNSSMEAGNRTHYIDIPIFEYINSIYNFINPEITNNNRLKFMEILRLDKNYRDSSPLTSVYSSLDLDALSKEFEDIKQKQLYSSNERNHNVNHVERVMVLASLIGKEEINNPNKNITSKLRDMLLKCAKYHDCGRINDKVDKEHGRLSAEIMKEPLEQEGYSEGEIRIMQAAVELHNLPDYKKSLYENADIRKVFDKYLKNEQEKEITLLITNCLKDADALDRVRFKNRATLNESALRTSTALKLVPVAKELVKRYDELKDEEFYMSCNEIYLKGLHQEEQERII